MHRIVCKSQTNKRNDVIKMMFSQIEFANVDEIVETFESRFLFARVEMSSMIRDSIHAQFTQYNDEFESLKFNVDEMHKNVETTLHMQIAINFTSKNLNCDDNNYVINIAHRDNLRNQTQFEIIHVESMFVIFRIVVDANCKIHNIDANAN